MKTKIIEYIFYLSVLFIYMLLGIEIHHFVMSFMVVAITINHTPIPLLGDLDKVEYRVIKTCISLILFVLLFSITSWLVVLLCIIFIYYILNHYINKTTSAFKSMSIIGMCLIAFSSVSIRQFEIIEESNIKNGFDAIWWTICTITTVGYGDKFPVTESGKVIALILMVCGIGLFGTLIGYVSTFFIDRENSNNDKVDTIEELSSQMRDMQDSIELLLKNKN